MARRTTEKRKPTERFPTPELRGAGVALLKCRDAEVLIAGAAGTGKSTSALLKVHYCCEHARGRPVRCLIVRKTRESLTESGLATYENKILGPHHPARRGPIRRIRQSYRYPNGSEIVVGGIDKPSKIMSTDFDLIFVQESTELSEEDWGALLTRIRNGAMPLQQLMGDCNPSAPTHWLKRRCDRGVCRLLESFHEDNPSLHDGTDWTEQGKKYLEKLDALPPIQRARLRCGKWVQAEGAVYPAWDPRLHVIDHERLPPEWAIDDHVTRPAPVAYPPPHWRRLWSVDFGLSNPFCLQSWAVDHDGRAYLYREIYRTGVLVPEHAAHALRLLRAEAEFWARRNKIPLDSAERMLRPETIICDPEGAQERGLLERHLGMPTVGARKDVRKGVQVVSDRLRPSADGRPRLQVVRGCLVGRDPVLDEARKPQGFLEEVDGYVWDPGKERPVDRDNHSADALRYLCVHLDFGFSGCYEAAQVVPASSAEAPPAFRVMPDGPPRMRYGASDGGRPRRGGRLFGGAGA